MYLCTEIIKVKQKDKRYEYTEVHSGRGYCCQVWKSRIWDRDCKKTLSAFTDFFIPADFQRLSYVEQLVGYVYQLSAGRQANEHVVKEYKEYTRYYISGLISETEEAFLVDNFDILLDYAFEHLNVIATLGLILLNPRNGVP